MVTDIMRMACEAMEEGEKDDIVELYRNKKVPEYGEIDNWEDFAVAVMQKAACGDCHKCYWDRHCGSANVGEEGVNLSRKTKKPNKEAPQTPQPDPTAYIACECCAYATQTNPRICMNPNSIAKHSYVKDTSYCDQYAFNGHGF